MSSQELSQETAEPQVQQTVSAGTPSPWPVEAIRAAASGSCRLPERAAAILVVRVGQPHGRARGVCKKDVHFDVAEGYAVFREKCLTKFTEVSTSPDALRRPIQLPENGADMYLKKARNDSQEIYVRLSSENFAATLLHRLSLLTQNDLARLGDFRFEAFLYVERAAAPEQFHRATTQRVENARVQRMA
ncbi:hypothetical protein PF008_g23330 [Phytophthora fragariae]|uniref:Uncharacterized protein n=1 Tax=Phytophthora fragariae TaxID=53985 RepID=A0A6G0QRA9_9STRA|nr:hypothetical protein PF008_g23330 [Phytophthora fragariae]